MSRISNVERERIKRVAAKMLTASPAQGSFAAPTGLGDEENQDFPPAARHFLTAFYEAKLATTDEQKCAALRKAYELENAVITADGLKVLEFYALSKCKII